MEKLIFATNNIHKSEEIKKLLRGEFEILSLKDIGFSDTIPETSGTIAGNSRQKAEFIYNLYKINCFADDTGLEVEALNGAPGVYSARYAGENATYEDNVKKLLQELNGQSNRNARFVTVITLILDGKFYTFEGEVKGKIIEFPLGNNGFGYDPVFLPEGFKKTFAQMTIEEKNKISHRAKATEKLVKFLRTIKQNT